MNTFDSLRKIEEAYLQVLVESLPELHGQRGFFVQADATCKNLCFIPRFTDISSFDFEEKKREFVNVVCKEWDKIRRNRIYKHKTLHKKVLKIASILQDEWHFFATHFLLRMSMPLLGSAFHRNILSKDPFDANNLRPFATQNYPNEIKQNTNSHDFREKTLPILVAEYLCACSNQILKEVDLDTLDIFVIWLPLRSLAQIRGAAVWFVLSNKKDHKDIIDDFIVLLEKMNIQRTMEQIYSSAINDIFFASLIDIIEKTGIFFLRKHTIKVFSQLYLCDQIIIVIDENHGQIWKAQNEEWVLSETISNMQSFLNENPGIYYEWIIGKKDLAQKIGFKKILFKSRFPENLNNLNQKEPIPVPLIFRMMLEEKLLIIIKNISNIFYVVTHRFKNLYTRNIFLTERTIDQVSSLIRSEYLFVSGFQQLISGEEKAIDWDNGDNKIGRLLEKAFSSPKFSLQIDDKEIINSRLDPAVFCIILELITNAKKHIPKVENKFCMLKLTRVRKHGKDHCKIQLTTLAKGRDIRNIQARLGNAKTGGLATIKTAAAWLSCYQCEEHPTLFWKFECFDKNNKNIKYFTKSIPSLSKIKIKYPQNYEEQDLMIMKFEGYFDAFR